VLGNNPCQEIISIKYYWTELIKYSPLEELCTASLPAELSRGRLLEIVGEEEDEVGVRRLPA
jgi:hypothetical protein